MTEKTDNLTPKQQKAISCLLTESTVAKAAVAAGVGERTLHRWLEDTDFVAAYKQARFNVSCQATSRLLQASSEAATVLMTLMLDKNTPASVRLGAARSVLEFTFKAVELEQIESRLTALEGFLKEKK